jgi:hypothetical protein
MTFALSMKPIQLDPLCRELFSYSGPPSHQDFPILSSLIKDYSKFYLLIQHLLKTPTVPLICRRYMWRFYELTLMVKKIIQG